MKARAIRQAWRSEWTKTDDAVKCLKALSCALSFFGINWVLRRVFTCASMSVDDDFIDKEPASDGAVAAGDVADVLCAPVIKEMCILAGMMAALLGVSPKLFKTRL